MVSCAIRGVHKPNSVKCNSSHFLFHLIAKYTRSIFEKNELLVLSSFKTFLSFLLAEISRLILHKK